MQRSSGSILAVAVTGWFGLSACDTSAVGVESCRQIEYARCNAAVHCPNIYTISDPTACRRFYRDHCLHGLPLAQDPGAAAVNPCVNAINAIATCAEEKGGTTALNQCDRPSNPTAQELNSTAPVCDLIRDPETISQCSFLNPGATAGDSGSN